MENQVLRRMFPLRNRWRDRLNNGPLVGQTESLPGVPAYDVMST